MISKIFQWKSFLTQKPATESSCISVSKRISQYLLPVMMFFAAPEVTAQKDYSPVYDSVTLEKLKERNISVARANKFAEKLWERFDRSSKDLFELVQYNKSTRRKEKITIEKVNEYDKKFSAWKIAYFIEYSNISPDIINQYSSMPPRFILDCIEKGIPADSVRYTSQFLYEELTTFQERWIKPEQVNWFDDRFFLLDHFLEVIQAGYTWNDASAFDGRFKYYDVIKLMKKWYLSHQANTFPERFSTSDIDRFLEKWYSGKQANEFNQRFGSFCIWMILSLGWNWALANRFDVEHFSELEVLNLIEAWISPDLANIFPSRFSDREVIRLIKWWVSVDSIDLYKNCSVDIILLMQERSIPFERIDSLLESGPYDEFFENNNDRLFQAWVSSKRANALRKVAGKRFSERSLFTILTANDTRLSLSEDEFKVIIDNIDPRIEWNDLCDLLVFQEVPFDRANYYTKVMKTKNFDTVKYLHDNNIPLDKAIEVEALKESVPSVYDTRDDELFYTHEWIENLHEFLDGNDSVTYTIWNLEVPLLEKRSSAFLISGLLDYVNFTLKKIPTTSEERKTAISDHEKYLNEYINQKDPDVCFFISGNQAAWEDGTWAIQRWYIDSFDVATWETIRYDMKSFFQHRFGDKFFDYSTGTTLWNTIHKPQDFIDIQTKYKKSHPKEELFDYISLHWWIDWSWRFAKGQFEKPHFVALARLADMHWAACHQSWKFDYNENYWHNMTLDSWLQSSTAECQRHFLTHSKKWYFTGSDKPTMNEIFLTAKMKYMVSKVTTKFITKDWKEVYVLNDDIDSFNRW